MKRYYIVKDEKIEASAATRESAIKMIQSCQKEETHYMLRANFSIIYGEEEFIPYVK